MIVEPIFFPQITLILKFSTRKNIANLLAEKVGNVIKFFDNLFQFGKIHKTAFR